MWLSISARKRILGRAYRRDVFQPELGASLRKGWYRMVGTMVGAVAVVALTALFPEPRGVSRGAGPMGSAVRRGGDASTHFASYAAALAGYTAVVVAADALGATGGPKANEVSCSRSFARPRSRIGIVSAGVVLAGTDFSGGPATPRRILCGLAC